MIVVAEAANGREGIILARSEKPDVIVMDISMPDLNGMEATQRIVADNQNVRIIGLSMNADRRYVVAMLEAGAAGYVLKNAAAAELIRAIHVVRSDRRYLSPEVAWPDLEFVSASSASTREDPLSAREREVLQLLAEGQTSKEIGATLDVDVATVETHRRRIMAKLKFRTVAELTKYAVREGLTSS